MEVKFDGSVSEIATECFEFNSMYSCSVVLSELRDKLRDNVKHADKKMTAEEIYELLFKLCDEHGISLWEV